MRSFRKPTMTSPILTFLYTSRDPACPLSTLKQYFVNPRIAPKEIPCSKYTIYSRNGNAPRLSVAVPSLTSHPFETDGSRWLTPSRWLTTATDIYRKAIRHSRTKKTQDVRMPSRSFTLISLLVSFRRGPIASYHTIRNMSTTERHSLHVLKNLYQVLQHTAQMSKSKISYG